MKDVVIIETTLRTFVFIKDEGYNFKSAYTRHSFNYRTVCKKKGAHYKVSSKNFFYNIECKYSMYDLLYIFTYIFTYCKMIYFR